MADFHLGPFPIYFDFVSVCLISLPLRPTYFVKIFCDQKSTSWLNKVILRANEIEGKPEELNLLSFSVLLWEIILRQLDDQKQTKTAYSEILTVL